MILALLLAGLLLVGTGCVLEDKVIELIVMGETCADYEEVHDSASWNNPLVLNYAEEIDRILRDNDLDRSDIKEAYVKGATYTVTDFSHDHDWNLTGAITVTWQDQQVGPHTIVTYTQQSLQAALGVEVNAVLDEAGVTTLNHVLEDYIENGTFPTVIFEVVNDFVVPEPTPQDMLVFDWTACIQLHIVVEEDVELPDWP
jgi:hypothetical protein